MNDTIWIVIPVYNAQKTLKRCLNSIKKQTYSNWRAILIDDGSKDKSGAICDSFAKKDNRIQVIHTQNGGPANARKIGMEALPEDGYCCFCDSDDWFPADALQSLIDEAVTTKADMVVGKANRAVLGYSLRRQYYQLCFDKPGYYDYEKMMKELYVSSFGSYDFPMTLWAKIINISKLKKVMFEEIETPFSYAEDLDIIMRLMPTLSDAVVCDKMVYYYNMGGGTSKFMKHFLTDSALMYGRKKEYAKHFYDYEKAIRMTSNEYVSFSMTQLIMCERFKVYPHGELIKEAEYVCGLPQMKDALAFLGEDDSGHFIGTGKAFVNCDYEALASFARQKAKERKYKDMLLKLIFR